MASRKMAIALSVAGAAIATMGHAAPDIVWHAASEYPATTMPGMGLSTFAEQIRAHTGGRLDVIVRHDDPLDALAALNAARDGRIDIGDVHAGPLGLVEPIFNLVTLPFIATSAADTQCLQAATRAVYTSHFDRLGVHLLYSAPWPATGLWSTTAVATLDDLRHLNVRTYDATSAAFLTSLGVPAEHLPMARAMPLVANGTYTAVMSSGDGGAGQRLWQYLRHFTALNYAAPLSFAILNKRAYESLPHELRARVDAAAADTETQLWAIMRDRDASNRKAMREHGVEVHDRLDPTLADALHAASGRAIDMWVARTGPDGKALLDRYRASPCALR